VKSSIFSLIILCLGAGTLSIPYVFYANGIVFGTFLLLMGGLLSIYTGWLVVICCHRLNASRYEEIALSTYGKKASIITSACMLACLIGFVMSYIVLFKELMPYTIQKLSKQPLPEFIGMGKLGQIFWASIFSVSNLFINVCSSYWSFRSPWLAL
jgi:amino acid permease